MSRERSSRIRELFDRASLLGADDGEAFLRQECGADAELLAEVQELLSYDQPTGQLRIPPIFERLEDEPIPARIGPYEVGRRIGEGGFGEVYEAQQKEPFQRSVALKLMKPGHVTRELLARFEGERQALAMLNHPGIAKIFDAGATERGRLYFVMELVDGESITQYCDREELGLDARLELFSAVCRAVEHAHRRGIIHRDIKPSNVLVARTDRGPEPKVIDFGVAKAGGHALSRETLITQQGQLIGTPEYMSPEQADFGGLDVDTRTDVYALGVLLYELLTGSLPFEPDRLRSGSFGEALRIIREEEPERPSLRVRTSATCQRLATQRGLSPRRLEQALAGELDWIVLKALEKDRERRYASANDFALDVERHRSREAVEAGPPSAIYRMGKFARRHRVALVMTAALFLATLVSAVESNRRRWVAEAARQESEAVSRFLAETLGASNPLKEGRDVTVVKVLERAVSSDLEQFQDQPLVRARLQHTIGEVYTRLGLTEEARGLLEEALDTRRELLGEEHLLTADTLNMLGVLFRTTGEFDLAMHHFQRAGEIFRAEHGPDHVTMGQTLNNQAGVLRELGRYAEAQASFEEALSIRERHLGPKDPLVAHTLVGLGGLFQTMGERERALPIYERALAILEERYGPEHAQLMPVLSNLGSALDVLGDKTKGAMYLRRCVTIGEQALGPDHPEVGVSLLNLAVLTKEVLGPEAAAPMYERVLSIWESKLGPDHPKTERAYMSLAILRGEGGDYATAAELLEKALASREKRVGPDHVELAYPLYYLGLSYRELGRLERAKELLEQSLVLEENQDPESMNTAATLEGLMLVARDLGNSAEQADYEERMRAIVAKLKAKD